MSVAAFAYICYMDTKQILILIGFAIYYFLRANGNKDKKQKKAAPKRAQPRPTSAKPQKSLEEILRDLANQGEEVEKPKPKPVPPAYEYEKPVEQPKPTVKKEYKVTAPLEVHETDEEDSAEFDLKQAVINDAILNRPWK